MTITIEVEGEGSTSGSGGRPAVLRAVPPTLNVIAYAGDYLKFSVQFAQGSSKFPAIWTAQIRKNRTDSTVAETFTVTPDDDLFKVVLELSAEQVAGLCSVGPTLPLTLRKPNDAFKGHWDLQYDQDGKISTALSGTFDLVWDVTRL